MSGGVSGRVLDLADVYVRVCPRSVGALSLLPGLVSLLASCAADSRQAPLVARLRGCLARLTGAAGPLPDQHGVTQSLLAELVRDVLSSGARREQTGWAGRQFWLDSRQGS